MYNNKLRGLLLVLFTLSPVVTLADWTGQGEVGAALSNNSTGAYSSTLAAKLDIARRAGSWKYAAGASTVYTSAKAEAELDDPSPIERATDDRWETHHQTEFKFTDKAFVFAGFRYEHDQIGTYRYQSVLASGLGYTWIEATSTQLATDLGVGYKKFKPQVDSAKSSIGEVVMTSMVNLERSLSRNLSLSNKLSLEAGSSNAFFQNDLSLKTKITDVLALAIDHQLRYNTNPLTSPVTGQPFAHTDHLLTANLVYEFK